MMDATGRDAMRREGGDGRTMRGMDGCVRVSRNSWELVGIRRVLARGASSGTHRLPGRVAHPFIPCARARSGSEGRTREDAKGGGEAGEGG